MRFLIALLSITALVGAADSKPAIEVMGPESLDSATLLKGVTWEVLSRNTSGPVSVKVASSELSVKVRPAEIAAKPASIFVLTLTASVTPPGKETTATVFFLSATNQILAERKLTVGAASYPKIAIVELSNWKMRGWWSPLFSAGAVCEYLPLSGPLPPGSPSGPLLAAASGAGAAGVELSMDGQNLCIQAPQAAVYTGDIAPTWNGKPLGTVKLKYTIADGPILAILCAVLGVLTAWWLKRTLNVTRVVAALRLRSAKALQRFNSEVAPAFQQIISTRPRLAHLSLQPSAVALWTAADASVDGLKRPFLIKLDDRDLKASEDQVMVVENVGGEWLRFGKAQAELDTAADAITSAASESELKRPSTFAGSPELLVTIAGGLRTAGVAPANLSNLRQVAETQKVVATDWIRIHDATLRLHGDWLNNPGATASSNLKQLHLSAVRLWNTIWSKLWNNTKPDDIAGIAALVTQLAAAVAGIQNEKGMESDSSAGQLPPRPDITVNIPAIVEQAAGTVRTSEGILLVVGLGLAITAGMSASYLGQPFGSLKNYLDLFLWGAGTKTGLDLLMPLVEQLATLVPRSAVKT